MKADAFTLSMNAKVKADLQNVISYFIGQEPDAHFAMWIEREVMENASTFEEAHDYLSKVPQLAGCYYILGGVKPGQSGIREMARSGNHHCSQRDRRRHGEDHAE